MSKLDFARYFERIGEWIVPHVQGRPLTLLHCPGGVGAPCMFLRHAKAWGPSALRRIRIQEKTKVGEYLIADSIEAVVALAQMGIVEIHTWNSTADDHERPNRVVWDLDPGPDVPWKQTVAAARLLRSALETLGLTCWLKTTGGSGLHVVAPLKPAAGWADCLAFSKAVSETIAQSNPALYTTAFPKRGREAKILLDYLRNNRTNTSVCAYSPRARPAAPVSMPIRWDELSSPASRWGLNSVVRRLQRVRSDPWEDYWTSRQRLSKHIIGAVRRL